ncbi:MAG: methyltransferase domain-containing protein [Burkholderiales bacterium]|nr:methyltransferase domain-containing protein [Burkholderiales bacterium]
MAGPTREFWEQHFAAGRTPWDRGEVNPQLHAWLEAGTLSPCRILVPGCGTGYEVAVLARKGFEVTGLDYAAEAIERTRRQLQAANASATLVRADALAWDPKQPFDAIYEQTCLCAIYPDRWVEYGEKLWRWLVPDGRLYALFAQIPRPGGAEGKIEGPPYHCDINGMRALFPQPRWAWPKPPYARVPHPLGLTELAVVLSRIDA